MQTVAPFYPKCAISQTMKSQGRSVLQYNAKEDLILISKKKLFSCNFDVFCDKGMAIPQIKFGFFSGLQTVGLAFFWPLFCIVWLFIENFIWQPCPYVHTLIKPKLTISCTTASVEHCLSKMAVL